MSRSISTPIAIEYPSGDGKPMAENDAQLLAMHYAIGALWVRYRDRADVYVSGDLLMYYEEGNPKASVAPDVFEEAMARQAAEARVAELEALLDKTRS